MSPLSYSHPIPPGGLVPPYASGLSITSSTAPISAGPENQVKDPEEGSAGRGGTTLCRQALNNGPGRAGLAHDPCGDPTGGLLAAVIVR